MRNSDSRATEIVTVHQYESGVSQPRRATLDVIRRAFESAGVEFIDENGGGPGGTVTKAAPQKKLGLSNTSVARALKTAELQTEMTCCCVGTHSPSNPPGLVEAADRVRYIILYAVSTTAAPTDLPCFIDCRRSYRLPTSDPRPHPFW